jgi:hypothetical protein
VTASDDPFGIEDDAGVIKEYADVIFCREQRADVTGQDEVRLFGALEGVDHAIMIDVTRSKP